ncbi:MAG: cytochrome c biogenesis protein ResB [Comamonas sp.]|nr:cytochrome c biogenesis protein ResB [Comamonas sp.]
MSDFSLRWRNFLELLASMRFAIALLTVICIASVIGTVIQQHEPVNNYVNQFGPFWSELFLALKLNAVYSAWWFLLILAFLVVSTSLCLMRHTPKYLADLRNFKEDIREKSLSAFGHKAQNTLAEAPQAAAQRIGQGLAQRGWRVKMQERDTANGKGYMVAAKAGAANKLGYIAAHTAIVLICIGGLLDGDLIVRAQMWMGGKTPYVGGGRISDVPDQHRLSMSNPTYRGNLFVAEGTQASTALLSQSDGMLLQPLPFSVELKKFIVEYYSTGMPKLFASEVLIHDLATGETTPKRIEVNHPASYKGVEIYQSSFDDGGSRVKLSAQPFQSSGQSMEVEGVIGESTTFTRKLGNGQPDERMALEFTELRTINVENFSNTEPVGSSSAVDVRKVDLRNAIESRLGAGHKTATEKKLRNIGPSVGYKLRDQAGQAIEYHNYMLPVDMGEGPVYLLGMREVSSEPFRYLRVPVDHEGSLDGFVRLRQGLSDPSLRQAAIERYVSKVSPDSNPESAAYHNLLQSTVRALELFAGSGQAPDGGLQGVGQFIEANVPPEAREQIGETLLRLISGSLLELAQISRQSNGLPLLDTEDDTTQAFMTKAVLALSDAQFYPAPMVFMLQDFEQVQASVFQVARAPGKNVVYLGCVFLIIGVFAMLYVRDRRLWVWLAPTATAEHSQAQMAMSCNRKLLDVDREFEQLAQQLLAATPTPAPTIAPEPKEV